MPSKGLVIGAACGLALGVGVIAAVDAGTQSASAQGGFTVSAAQLKINQNISSAAVKRSNRGLNYLAPIRTTTTDAADDGSNGVRPLNSVPGSGQGWTSSQIGTGAITREKVANEAIDSEKIAPNGVTSGDLADNAVTNSKIDGGAVTRAKIANGLLSYWLVSDNQGNKVRSQPATATSTRIAAGTYAVTFPDAIEQCAYQVSIASPNNQPPTPLNNGAISAFAQSAVTIEVRTYSLQVSPPVLQDRPFHLTVNC
jgi:hypothetical protein